MALKPLLPCYETEIGWPQTETEPGLYEIQENDFPGRLYTVETVIAKGVPSPLAQAFAFKWVLEHGVKWKFSDGEEILSSKVFSVFIKGLFTGVLRLEQVPLNAMGPLGEVLRVALPASVKSFDLIAYSGKIIGGTYHETFVFPSASLKSDLWSEIEKLVSDIDLKTLSILKGWTDGQIRRLESGEEAFGYRRPLWLRQIYKTLDGQDISSADQEKIESSTILFPEVILANGSEGYLSLSFPQFVRSVLRCPLCEFILSSVEGEQTIDAVNNLLTCPHCKKTFAENFGERGFFLDKEKGKYIIWNLEGGARPDGCTDVSYDEDAAVYVFGNHRIRVLGEVLDQYGFACQSVIGFSQPDGGTKIPDLPVKGEYLGYVLGVESTRREGERAEWRLALRGQPSTLKFEAKVQLGKKGEHEGSILVWPSFKAKDWNVYYLYFICTDLLDDRGVAIRPITKGEGPTSISIRSKKASRVHHPLESIEVLIGDSAAGIFHFTPEAVRYGGSSVRVSLDFGTSNTCAAIRTGFEEAQEHKYDTIEFTDMTHDILGTYYAREKVAKESNWLPTYGGKRGGRLRSFPAELIFESVVPELPEATDSEYAREIIERIGYMVPNPQMDRNEAVALANFKWEIAEESTLSDRRETVVKKYLHLILHMLLGELRSSKLKIDGQRVIASGIKLVATYPLAFGKERHRAYIGILQKLAEILQQETGMMVDVEPPGLLNESYAGKSSVGSPGGLELVADLGGGTTDIVLSDKDGLIFVDSIRYAGNDLLGLLASKKYLPDQQKEWLSSLKDLKFEGKRAKLQQIFRNEEPEVIWKELYRPERLKKVKPIVHLFFEGLIWYMASLVTSHLRSQKEPKKRKLTIFLLGNGWNFIWALGESPRTYIGEVMQVEVARLSGGVQSKVSIQIDIPDISKYGKPLDPKEATAIGALQCEMEDPGVLDGIQSIVGCETVIGVGKNTVRLKPDDLVPAKISSAGRVNSINCDGLLDVIPEEWKNPPLQLDSQLIQILNQKSVASIGQVGRVLKLQKSILSRFLEEIYRHRLSKIKG